VGFCCADWGVLATRWRGDNYHTSHGDDGEFSVKWEGIGGHIDLILAIGQYCTWGGSIMAHHGPATGHCLCHHHP